MRPDMGKCVLEEPRRGHASKGFKSRNFGKMVDRGDGIDYEGPMRIPNSMNYGQRVVAGPKSSWDDKSFSDSLGPIYGYLHSKVGQPWDKVYSEIRQNLGKGGWPIRHIIHAHLDVEEHCWEDEDGCIHYNTTKYYYRNRGSVSGFYVHPRTKILCYEPEGHWGGRGPGFKRKEKSKPVVEFEGPDGWTYQKIDGLWFKIRYGVIFKPVWKKNYEDFRMKRDGHLEEEAVPVTIYKKSCNRKELAWIRQQPGV